MLDYLELNRMHFVGNSLGGLVGYELLEMEPARLASLATFGTTAELHASRAVTWFLLGTERLLGPRPLAWLTSKTASKDPAVARRVGQMYRDVDRKALLVITKNIANYDYTGTLRHHDLPLLLLRGEHDREINANLDSTLAVLAQKPGARVVDLESAGHFANMEAPERFNRALLDFLP